MDLTGITNQNEYYTNHYFSSVFQENASGTISRWRAEAKGSGEARTPWAQLRDAAKQFYPVHDRFLRSKFDTQTLANIRALADVYLSALGYPAAAPEWVDIGDAARAPVYLELKKPNGAPALWVLLAASDDKEAAVLDKFCFSAGDIGAEGLDSVSAESLTAMPNEDLVTTVLFGQNEPPRFIILIVMNQIALIDRNKWNEKRYLQFELEEIFSRHEESTLQAMAVLLHRSSLCPEEGTALLDELDASSQKHAAGVSQDLKYALRESIELLGNEVLYDMAHRQGRDLNADPVDAGQLTIECLRYMYRMLFVLFIEARPELGYAPIRAQAYLAGYSLESLRDIADGVRDDVAEVGGGYYLHESLSKLYELICNGYPETEEEVLKYSNEGSLHGMFVIAPLKAHIFDPGYTRMITKAKLRNSVMLRTIDLMSLTRAGGRHGGRRGRISCADLGIDRNPVAVELAEVSLWLNTIYAGGFVPWFGTQLVNGNSLIGARRQAYPETALTATSRGLRWYENVPKHIPLGTQRKKRRGSSLIDHFLLGDPGMCSYPDKVIKSLKPDSIKAMAAWKKKFTAPYSPSEIETLRGLSDVIDELWTNQVRSRQTVRQETQDALSVYGYSDTAVDPHTTIRQKDQICSRLYKSEHMLNAGPYARLKFAMDYWCALWFWPVDQADMLPSRSEFLNDLDLILVGTFSTRDKSNMQEYGQLSLFPTEQDRILMKIYQLFPGQNVVDIDNLCALFPCLALVREIAEQNHFMHWELEFADLFAERGGFDLIIGNPPWIKIEWNEQGVLAPCSR